jgi:hypothetical protein
LAIFSRTVLRIYSEVRNLTKSRHHGLMKVLRPFAGTVGDEMSDSPQAKIVRYLVKERIAIQGHIHDGCNLGNCPYLAIDFSTPEGLRALGDALEFHLFKKKAKAMEIRDKYFPDPSKSNDQRRERGE